MKKKENYELTFNFSINRVSLKRPNEEGNLTQTNNVSLFFTIKDQPSNRTSNFGVEEYVNVINDALKMNKNVCIARYFDQVCALLKLCYGF